MEPNRPVRPRRPFIAGATGATGRTLLRLARAHGVEVVPHRRPKAGRPPEPGWAEFELADHAALVDALRGCTTVVQLIGTMRKRFASGDTYETSDIGTTRQLAQAAAEAGVDHFVLLSSVGAGRPSGAYLRAKAEAERLVRESGVPWTILRPSAFLGEGHSIPWLAVKLTGLSAKYRAIEIDDLGRALLQVATARVPVGGVLEGPSLWHTVETARVTFPPA